MKKFHNQKIIKGSLLLTAGAFLSKLLGAIYRVPLTNLLGAEGLGAYQMIFPVYCVLLDFSGAGAPGAISKLIAEKKDDQNFCYTILKGSIKLFAVFGIVASLLMLSLSGTLAKNQGSLDAELGYVFLSPAVFFVSLISCFRGYFQGKMDMFPTALSQIIEQTVKLVVGVLLVSALVPKTKQAVAGATFAVTVSEVVAFTFLFVIYKRRQKNLPIRPVYSASLYKSNLKRFLKYLSLVTAIGIAIPVSQVIDSFLIVNILSKYRSDATALYGLFSGTATTVINLPVAVCYGLATVAIPAVSGAKTEKAKRFNTVRVMLFTIILAVPLAIICCVFSPLAVRILFSRLNEVNKAVTVSLIRSLSINVIFLSLLQTENAVLIGRGKPLFALIGTSSGIVVKIILNTILLKIPSLNIYGAVIGVIACYFIACLINLILIIKTKVSDASKTPCSG